jgi:hypothetical protein
MAQTPQTMKDLDQTLAEAERTAQAEAAGGKPAASASPRGRRPAAKTAEAPQAPKAAKKDDGKEEEAIPAPQPLVGLLAESVRSRFRAIQHLSRSLVAMGGSWEGGGPVGVADADDKMREMCAGGWEPIALRTQGISPEGGINTLWVWGLLRDGIATRWKDMHHIIRPYSPGESSFKADLYVSGFLADGWELFETIALGMGPEGWFLMWVLVLPA